jgi:hypothetical protein
MIKMFYLNFKYQLEVKQVIGPFALHPNVANMTNSALEAAVS